MWTKTLWIRAGLLILGLLGGLYLPARTQKMLDTRLVQTFQSVSLPDALGRVAEEIEGSFSYNPTVLPQGRRVSLRKTGKPLRDVLDDWLEGTRLRYREVGLQIIIYQVTPQPKKESTVPRKQQSTVSGYVVDARSGERLPYAKVWDLQTGRGAVANSFGFFSLSIPRDSVSLMASFPEYMGRMQTFLLQQNRQVELSLQPYLEMNTVAIEAEKNSTGPEEAGMSTISLPVGDVLDMPALLGEADVIRAVQLLPGVQSGAEGTTGLYVRGGSPDQNLILLDGVPLYYVNHWGGFASVFNADALSDVRLIKGGFPARFGGRLSSVLEVTMKEGDRKKTRFSGTIGLLSAKASVQGPIGKKAGQEEARTSYIISARRNYFDLIYRGINALTNSENTGEDPFNFGFYDVNAKVNHIFSEKDRLYLSAYMGQDRARTGQTRESFRSPDGSTSIGVRRTPEDTQIEEQSTNRFAWGNRMVSLRWNHLWNPKTFSNLTLSYSHYAFETDRNFETVVTPPLDSAQISRSSRLFSSGISDAILRWETDWYPHHQHRFRFGVQAASHTYTPGITQTNTVLGNITLEDTLIGDGRVRGLEGFGFIEYDWQLGQKFRVNAGLHAAAYRFNQRTYTSLQPRISARYLISDRLAFKASYASMTQFLHLLTNQSVGVPVDLWVPATDSVPPQQAHQVAAGLSWSSQTGEWEAMLEGYYKQMTDLIDYQEGYSQISQTTLGWENVVEKDGRGETYGAELFIRKKRGKLRGWLGYTLSWNWRTFENINGGERYPFRYDRRHDVSLVAMYTLRPGIELSANWVFGTGQSITLATGRHESFFSNQAAFPSPQSLLNDTQGDIYLYEGGRNNVRMRSYHRLDVGVSFIKEKTSHTRTWRLGLYNTYSRRNPFYYYYDVVQDNEGGNRTVLTQFSLFPVTPSVSYSISF